MYILCRTFDGNLQGSSSALCLYIVHYDAQSLPDGRADISYSLFIGFISNVHRSSMCFNGVLTQKEMTSTVYNV